MGPPKPRSRTQSESRAEAPSSAEECEFARRVKQTFSHVADDALVIGREAKTLRDATASAITDAWKDARAATVALARQVNDSNQSLLTNLNESFNAVGQRIDQLPGTPRPSEGSRLPEIPYFTGANKDPTPFSVWLGRFEDIQNMRSVPLTPKLKANHLIGSLDGAARDKVEELTAEQRQDYDTVVAHLERYYEGPHRRNLARRSLSVCKQAPGESAASFADRIFQLVRAANPGQDPTRLQERMLEEFVARLRSDVRYQVELANPSTFHQAVEKAQIVEELSPVADHPIHSLSVPRSIPVNPIASRSQSRSAPRKFTRRDTSVPPKYNQFQARTSPRPPQNNRRPGITSRTQCYSCGGLGHMAQQCPSKNRRPTRGTRPLTNRYRSPRTSQRRSSPRIMNITPQDTSQELLDAHEKIKNLSVTLCAKQAALDDSEARISALVKRNDELANSSYNCISSSQTKSRTLPDVRLLMLCVLLSSFVSFVQSFDSPAWLCPKEPSDVIARVPLSYNCSRIIPRVNSIPKSLSIRVFRPNTQRYDTPASLCKIVTRTVHYSVNFFGARSERYLEKYEIVTAESCKYMHMHHKCEHGLLSARDDSWSTSNELQFEWPSAPFGCCVTHSKSVSNCYLIDTVIHMRHGSDYPDSSVGDLRKCQYQSGSCVMPDGSALIWKPNREESCQYISIAKMTGHILRDIWISDSKEFALSWHDDSRQVSDCGKELTVTDQGYAIMIDRRSPRSSGPIVGVVTTNQLAAQLLAVEDNVEVAVGSLFYHALSSLCDRTNLLALALHSSLSLNPTFAMRNLLNRRDLAASCLGNDLVQIHRCLAIPSSNYKIIPFNGTCFTKPLVELSLSSGATLHWYIDPSTFVISHEASPAECSSISPFYFADRSKYVRFDAILGQFTTLPYVETLASPPHLNSSSLALPLTIFHNLVLTNLTELTQDHQLRELWSTVDQERFLRIDKSSLSYGSAYSELTPTFSLFSMVFGSWSIFDVWVTSCSILVTCQVIKTVFILYIDLNYPGALSQFRGRFSRNLAGLTAPDISVTNVVRPPPTSIEPVELVPLTIDATSAWPPRASFNTVNVLAIRGDENFFVAQIPIKVNNINILALIDTGAVITVTSSKTAALLGVFALFESDLPSALGMAGIPIKLIGIAHLRFQIGSFTFNHPVYFTEAACVPESGASYNIILGNDLLSHLPSWCISYNRRLFTVAGEQINILCSAPTPAPLVDSTVPVRVAETTVLPPQAETFVPCFSFSNASTLVLTSQPATISDKYLMVSPAIISSGKSHVLVANPCASSQVVYQGQLISSALPYLLDEDFSYIKEVKQA